LKDELEANFAEGKRENTTFFFHLPSSFSPTRQRVGATTLSKRGEPAKSGLPARETIAFT
jgi:hypothetical protein